MQSIVSGTSGLWDTPNRELGAPSRWLSPDPAQSGWNPYAYVTNPNSGIDPLGLDPTPACNTARRGCPGNGSNNGSSGNEPFDPSAGSQYGGDLSGFVEGGYDIFDAIEGDPGTYLYINFYGQLSFGFSEDLWVAAENFMDQSNARLQSMANYFASQGMTLSWNPNPVLTVYIQDLGVETIASGLISDWLQLQANQQWIMSQLSPKEVGYFLDGEPAPSMLIPGNLQAYMVPYLSAYGDQATNYANEFNQVYGVAMATP